MTKQGRIIRHSEDKGKAGKNPADYAVNNPNRRIRKLFGVKSGYIIDIARQMAERECCFLDFQVNNLSKTD